MPSVVVVSGSRVVVGAAGGDGEVDDVDVVDAEVDDAVLLACSVVVDAVVGSEPSSVGGVDSPHETISRPASNAPVTFAHLVMLERDDLMWTFYTEASDSSRRPARRLATFSLLAMRFMRRSRASSPTWLRPSMFSTSHVRSTTGTRICSWWTVRS